MQRSSRARQSPTSRPVYPLCLLFLSSRAARASKRQVARSAAAPLHPQGPQLPHVRLARLPRRARPIQPVTTRSSSCRSRRRIEAGREARRCCSARARSVNRWRWPMRYKACPSAFPTSALTPSSRTSKSTDRLVLIQSLLLFFLASLPETWFDSRFVGLIMVLPLADGA